MLSILIPIYNFDVRSLIFDIHKQSSALGIAFEIICIDDCSDSSFKNLNSEISTLSHVSYQELDTNIGRSRIRNTLAKQAIYKNLLFLDCDTKPKNENYVKKYLDNLEDNTVIFGGRTHQEKPSNKSLYLRWLYGIKREQKTVSERKKKPYLSFMTNNFLIPKELFSSIQFEETVVGYGHEDTLFALSLQKRKINIKHIENPLFHIGLEENIIFLQKTEQGVKNLALLISESKIDEQITLYKAYKKLHSFLLLPLFSLLFTMFKPLIHKNLLSSNPTLILFDIYKLGLLIGFMKKYV